MPEEEKKKIKSGIDEIKKEVTDEIKFRQESPRRSTIGVRKTTELLGSGLHYFIDLEQKLTRDFLFGWLPEKIEKYVKLIIPLLALLVILYVPLDIDVQIRKALALFITIALLWALESISIVVTALLIPVLAVMLGLIKDTNPFTSFSNPIIYLLMSGLVIAQAFRKHNLDKLIAVRVLALSKGRIKLLLFYTMLTTATLGMWMSNTATIALLVPVIMSMSNEINDRLEKNYTAMLLLGAGFASSIGGLTTILGGNPNAITAAFLRDVADFTFLDWTIVGFPISVVLFILAYFVFLKIYHVGSEKVKIESLVEEAERTHLTRDQKKLLIIFFPTIFFWLFGGQLQNIVAFPIDFYRTEVIGLSAAILLFAFRVLEWDDVRRIPWEIFLIVGGGLTLGMVLIESGAAVFLADELFSYLAFLPDYFIMVVIVSLAIILANFVNNSSATIILVPVLLNLADVLDINYKLLAMVAAMATAIAPVTPIAMPSFSIIYGTGKVSRKEMIKTGITVAGICGPVLALMMYGMTFIY